MIVILKGGNSAEREVSLLTAKSIADSLNRQTISYIEVDAKDSDWLEQVKSTQPTKVVIALHGTFGEDGTIQKILQDNNIAFTGSNAESAGLTFDKNRAKRLVADKLRILTPKNLSMNNISNFPVVIKPNEQGSSFGVSIVKSSDELHKAVNLAEKYSEGETILCEEYIHGRELTCGVIDLFGSVQALPVVEIIPTHDFFDYDSKYTTESGCNEVCPAKIDASISKDIQEKSVLIHKLLGSSQYSRIDWILKDEGAYFLESNSLPGMTPTSLLPKELIAQDIQYDDFIKQLIS